MSRVSSLLLVVAVWAAVYLPALGSFEIKGEEGRRIFPAIAMLESGNYLVPQVGGDAYVHKPPLVNWLVAGSFKIFGRQNEWTARLPSVLCILAVAVSFITIAHKNLGDLGSLAAALIWLTNVGNIGKGRLIEIEALYVSLCAMAMICWLSWWQQQRSPWLTWLVPWIFLGLGWLAKGPTHLIFFYALVIAVLWQARQWRSFFNPVHLLGIVVMLAIFAAWAIPFTHAQESAKVLNKWSLQLAGRVTGEFFRLGAWLTSLPRALRYFLPWLLVTPFIRFNKLPKDADRKLACALMWSATVPLVFVSLIPGSAPRYSLPVLTPYCWLLGLVFAHDAFVDTPWLTRIGRPLWWRAATAFVALAVLVGLVGFPIAAMAAKHRYKVKNIAEVINQAVPRGETLYAVDPNYQPCLFYIHPPVKYVSSLEELPYDTRYFLVRPDNAEQAAALQRWWPRRPRLVLQKKDYRDETVILFAIDPG